MGLKLHFSSGTDDWGTPHEYYKPLYEQYNFTVDSAADQFNTKCLRWYGQGGERRNALSEPWDANERYWMNPPYSRGLQKKFIKQAVDVAKRGGFVVALIPSRTDTIVYHDFIWDKEKKMFRPWIQDCNFIKGRIKFIGAEHGAPFPSLHVIFHLKKHFIL